MFFRFKYLFSWRLLNTVCINGSVSPAGSHVIHSVFPVSSCQLVVGSNWLARGP